MRAVSVPIRAYPAQEFLTGTEPCIGVADPEVFFPHENGSAAAAKAICASCAVQGECLDYAMKTEARWGVWGGKSAEDRGHIDLNSRNGRRARKAKTS